MDTVSDIGHAEVNLDSRKRQRRRRRRRRQNRETDSIQLGKNINQANQNTEYSVDRNICMMAGGGIQGNIVGGDSGVELNTEQEKLVRVSLSTSHLLDKSVESGKGITRGMVIKEADPLNGSLGMDHNVIMSNLSSADACDAQIDDKSTKTMAIPQPQQQLSFRPTFRGMAMPPPPPPKHQPSLSPTTWRVAMPQQQQISFYPTTRGITTPQDSGLFVRKDSSIYASQHVNGVHSPSEITYSDVFNGVNLCFVRHLSVSRPPVVYTKKKLIVLDVNGLLAHIVMPPPSDCKADKHIAGRAIFKRPFYYDFLMFCCERFDVGIWSSRSKKIIDRVVDYLLGDLKEKLLFCWDMNQCTETRFKTLENKHKPLVFKELRKLWEKHYPDLPWEKGYYDESNTVLLDDSPYKALLNPLNTAIFPCSYQYGDKSDNSLGPGGNLRVYLERLATTDNIQKYIEQHPFGQEAIDESSPLWGFYSTVLHSCSVQDTNRW